ncbi:hypothetical protein PSTT_06515 [Puccinia striiformis]|uniref:Uncharacterized protein n=1 Tax=Puccinia striiformis TaxID=27350 RepID=A0A2S4VK28_9BASI|nr:hypothetical protein PSTT_06515 [Puccinia striiformis]
MKFVVVGDSSTGKSSLLVQLTDKRFLGQCDPTIGVEFGASLISLPDGKTIKAQVWDTAGQESFRSITRSYYRGAAGALLVFDTTYRKSFLNLSQWHEDLKSFGDPELTVVVVGNKSDLCPSSSTSDEHQDSDSTPKTLAREVSHDEALQWAEERGLDYIETSAKTGVNVEEAFAKVARKIYESGRLDLQNRAKPGSSFPLANTPQDLCHDGQQVNIRQTQLRLNELDKPMSSDHQTCKSQFTQNNPSETYCVTKAWTRAILLRLFQRIDDRAAVRKTNQQLYAVDYRNSGRHVAAKHPWLYHLEKTMYEATSSNERSIITNLCIDQCKKRSRCLSSCVVVDPDIIVGKDHPNLTNVVRLGGLVRWEAPSTASPLNKWGWAGDFNSGAPCIGIRMGVIVCENRFPN